MIIAGLKGHRGRRSTLADGSRFGGVWMLSEGECTRTDTWLSPVAPPLAWPIAVPEKRKEIGWEEEEQREIAWDHEYSRNPADLSLSYSIYFLYYSNKGTAESSLPFSWQSCFCLFDRKFVKQANKKNSEKKIT